MISFCNCLPFTVNIVTNVHACLLFISVLQASLRIVLISSWLKPHRLGDSVCFSELMYHQMMSLLRFPVLMCRRIPSSLAWLLSRSMVQWTCLRPFGRSFHKIMFSVCVILRGTLLQMRNFLLFYLYCSTSRSWAPVWRVKGTGGSAEEFDRETGEEQITVGWTCRKDGGWQTTEESGIVTRAGQEETRDVNAEMGGLC